MSTRAGCFTRAWAGRVQLSRAVQRVARTSKVSSRELLKVLRQHEKRLPFFLPEGRRVQTKADWSARDSVIATTVCDVRTGAPVTLVSFSWENSP